MPALQTCPFCDSGLAWLYCSCKWAIEAQRYGMLAARQRFEVFGGKLRPTRTLPETKPSVQKHDDTEIKPTRDTKALASPKTKPATWKKPKSTSSAPRKPKPKPNGENQTAEKRALGRPSTQFAQEGECAFCDKRRTMEAVRIARFQRKAEALAIGIRALAEKEPPTP